MNKIFSLLAFLFLLSTATYAQTSYALTFKAMGYEDDAIGGQSGSSAYYVKIGPEIDLKGSKLTIFFQPSQALIPNLSYINIIINDKSAHSSRLTKDSIQSITMDLSPADLSSDKFLKIQVKQRWL